MVAYVPLRPERTAVAAIDVACVHNRHATQLRLAAAAASCTQRTYIHKCFHFTSSALTKLGSAHAVFPRAYFVSLIA